MLTQADTLPELPFRLSDAKEHVGIELANDDVRLAHACWAVVDHLERGLNRSLAIRTWSWIAGYLPDNPRITLDKSPLLEIVSFTYYDHNNALQTLTGNDYYLLKPSDRKGWIQPKAGYWPVTYCRPDAVSITYKAGCQVLPDSLRHAAFMLLGTLNEVRESEITGTIATEIKTFERLIAPFRVRGYA